MCFYILKNYFNIVHNYILSYILSVYYEIPRSKINKFLDYKKDIFYIDSINIFNNDIDIIIKELLVGEYKILKINNNSYTIIKHHFDSIYFKKLFNSNNRKIILNYNDCIKKYIIDLIITIILLFPEPFILHLYSINNNTETIQKMKFNNDYIDSNILNLTLEDLHYFMRIINYFDRNDFNIFYEYILENSSDLQNDIIVNNIKIR